MNLRNWLFPSLAAFAASVLVMPVCAQTTSAFLRTTCVKVNPGAAAEFEKLQADAIQKLAQYRIKQGAMLRYALSRAALPAGEQAECDYLVSFTYAGFPPELTPESTAKNMKAAGVTMPYEAYTAKARSLAKTVTTRIVRVTASAGGARVGHYIHVNRMKIKNAQGWMKLETELWKPVQEARVADGQLSGWVSYTLVLPSGSSQPFQAVTVDGFPSWDAQGTQKPLSAYVKKAHPNMTMQQFNEAGSTARDLLTREVYKIVLEAR